MKLLSAAIVLTIMILGGSLSASAGVAPRDDGRADFFSALAEHFRLPESVVVSIHERRIPDDELAVVFFLAKQTGVRPDDVVDLRLLRKSWMELTLHFGLNPEVFYLPVTGDPAPPYGKGYGQFKKLQRTEWKKVVLDDEDIVNLVNLRFVSVYYRVSTEEVIRLRGDRRNFVAIATEISSPAYKARMAATDKAVRPHLREPKKK